MLRFRTKPPQPEEPESDGKGSGNEREGSCKRLRVARKTPEDIIKKCKRGQGTSGSTKQYEKQGNFEDTVRDFESLKPENVTTKGPFRDGKIVKVGQLPDGRTVVARNWSKSGKATLEFQKNPGFRGGIKVRYI